MAGRTKVLDVELSAAPEFLRDLEGYEALRALVRLHGKFVGHVVVPLLPGAPYTAADLRRVILRRLAWPILRQNLLNRIERAPLPTDGLDIEEVLNTPPPVRAENVAPLVTVAVCTRDRAEDLRLCLNALVQLDYPNLDILVVDNAPSSDATERLAEDYRPRVRYVREPKPGLDWARNTAIAEARGEIVAYTDDDVVVDRGWATALAAAFRDPQVMAVTGLIVPFELETEAQSLFERYGGFGRGFKRKYWRMDLESGERSLGYLGAGQYGTGANMAYRRRLFDLIGPFDPALDVGTLTNGGGDLEMFFRVLKGGYLLAYEPNAMVRHRHRRTYARLRVQLTNNGIGFFSYLVRTALEYPDTRVDVIRFGVWWFWWWHIRRLILSFIYPSRFPRDLIWTELWGALVGLWRYPKARRRATRVPSSNDSVLALSPVVALQWKPVAENRASVCVRTVDLCEPIQGLNDVADYIGVRVFALLDGRPVGSVNIDNRHQLVSSTRLCEAIVDGLGFKLLGRDSEFGPGILWDDAKIALRRRYLPITDQETRIPARLPEDVPVSVVVATYDRPDDLRECLSCLIVQESTRPVEIVVVDNHPDSGLSTPVVAEFPGVRLATETRRGLSYARNKGFTVSSGEIVIATDDDVLLPPDWLEKLIASFARPDVMVVTGNTLPSELETEAQRRFENYGGLGRGFIPKEADSAWFNSFKRRAVPTWELGATANAAFRASIFAHPKIGLLEETLGAGTPTGCSEDTYLFYKVLNAGYTIAYEPSAYVWHKHRREMRKLRSQIYNYSKGHVAYHLTTLLRDRDRRALTELVVRLPRWHLKQILRHTKRRLVRRSRYPLGLILLEIRGNLAGPWSLWRSHRRLKREGRSAPYTPTSRRSSSEQRAVKGNQLGET